MKSLNICTVFNFCISLKFELLLARAHNKALNATGADICQHRLYFSTLLQFFGLTVGRIVKRKTKSINFILSTIGQADIASNIPTAPSGAVMRTQFKAHFFFSTFWHLQFSLLTFWNINSFALVMQLTHKIKHTPSIQNSRVSATAVQVLVSNTGCSSRFEVSSPK